MSLSDSTYTCTVCKSPASITGWEGNNVYTNCPNCGPMTNGKPNKQAPPPKETKKV